MKTEALSNAAIDASHVTFVSVDFQREEDVRDRAAPGSVLVADLYSKRLVDIGTKVPMKKVSPRYAHRGSARRRRERIDARRALTTPRG